MDRGCVHRDGKKICGARCYLDYFVCEHHFVGYINSQIRDVYMNKKFPKLASITAIVVRTEKAANG